MERICNICQKTIQDKGLTAHLKKAHGVLFQDYVNNNLSIFPDYHKCENTSCDNIISPRRKACSRECDKAIRKTKVGDKSNRYGAKHSEKTLDKIKTKRKQQGNFKQGFIHSEESKQKMSQTRLVKGLGIGELNGMYGKTHTPESIQKIFKHRYKNKLEQLVCDTLDKHNISYTFQFFLTRDGICKSYDFHIHNTNILLEIDGDYWHGKDTAKNKFKGCLEVQQNDKIKTELARVRGFEVIRFWESEIKQNPDIIIKRLEPLYG
jgi:very-short-patch-repair endonuclease